ncbi:MAG TPA: PAS domain-containing protein [Candidatus Cybelea sp.]|nr:PAS domain-containing protein [Candidatus Cybelea sp.]
MEQLPPAIKSAFLRQVFEYWAAQLHGRRLPHRADIDPHALMLALPHIFIMDVERNPSLDFVFRVAGTFLEAAFDQTLTRKHLAEMKLDDHVDEIVSQYRQCVTEQRPICSHHSFVNQDQRRFDYERLLLPLAVDDDNRVDMILGAVAFDAPLPTPSVPFLARYQN